MNTDLHAFLDEHLNARLRNAVLSGRRTEGVPDRIRIRPVKLRDGICFQASSMKENQVFHKNYTAREMAAFLEEALCRDYRQLQVMGGLCDGTVLVSKKGKITIRTRSHVLQENTRMLSHNRVKQYILPEGTPVPFLVDLGVMTKEGRVIAGRYDKFRQINRFLEYVSDVESVLPKEREIQILDFGCGKSYLTFAVYYFLHEKLGKDVRITGLDLKKDVIEHCNALAVKYGYEKLSFYCGDVADYAGEGQVDLMLTLHACDTATDFALFHAVKAGAKAILSVPCCQHEVNAQIYSDLLSPALKYGIVKERMSALLTDAIRAELLSCCGYDAQLLEFIDMEHTPKNLLIRGIRTGKRKERTSLDEMLEALHLKPALYRLLEEEKLI